MRSGSVQLWLKTGSSTWDFCTVVSSWMALQQNLQWFPL